jgi:hypothetical protein
MSARGNVIAAVAGNGMIEGHEETLISRFLIDENAVRQYPDLQPKHFASPVHQEIFKAVLQLHYDGHAVNFMAVEDYFRRRGKLKEIGKNTLTNLVADNRVTAMDDSCFSYAFDCVMDSYRQREAAKIGEQLHKGEITLVEALEQLEKLHDTSSDALPAIQDAAVLLSAPIVLPDDVIEGMLHRAAKMVLGGASKSFKTWTLIDLAISVATGSEWFNGYSTKKGRVLYVNLELPGAWVTKRIRAVCDERQIEIKAGYLKVWNLRGYAADLSKLLPRLLGGIGHDEYALIIIDPIYKLLGARDENKAGDIATLLNEIEVLAVKTGAAIAFGAHYSKGNQASKEVIDRIGGSGVFARDPDTILNFTRHEEQNCFTVNATLRNHPPIEPFVVRWEYPLMAVDATLNPAKLKQAGRPEQHHAKHLLELIDKPMSATEIVKEAGQECGIPRRRVFELLAELKEGGLIRQPEKRGVYEPV